VNMSLNFLKKNYRLKEFSSDDFEAVYKEKGFDEVELKDYFDRVFKKLSPMEKAVLVLREVEGYSYREMAEMLECKEGTVMSRLHNARKKFRVISDLDTVNGGENSD
ncbi:RNA polymerase sigma factor, partial [bacterium]|nr:RNA polymerase sigma factor [bacterium]